MRVTVRVYGLKLYGLRVQESKDFGFGALGFKSFRVDSGFQVELECSS